MATAASQLCVRQASTLLESFIHHKGCKGEQISPLFHLYLYLFFTYISTSFSSSEELRSVLCQPGMPSTVQISIYTVYGSSSRLIAKEGKSTFQISSLLLSSFISNIYTPEKSYYWQNHPNSLKVKGYQEANSNVKQLLH